MELLKIQLTAADSEVARHLAPTATGAFNTLPAHARTPMMTIILHSFQCGSPQVQVALGSTVQQLINTGLNAFSPHWHRAYVWFGRQLQPDETLTACHIRCGEQELFTQDFAGRWTQFPHYKLVFQRSCGAFFRR